MMKKLILLVGLSLSICGCSWWPKLTTTPTVPTSVQMATVRKTSRPDVTVVGNTMVVSGVREEIESTMEYTRTPPPPPTFSQRIGRWIAALGSLAVIAIIIGIVVFPGATIALLVSWLKRWKAAALQTWKAIEKAKGTDDPELKRALEEKQTSTTKIMVKKAKENGGV